MKIKELIAELKKYDPELPVYFPGYTGFSRSINVVEKMKHVYQLVDDDVEEVLTRECHYVGEKEDTYTKDAISLS